MDGTNNFSQIFILKIFKHPKGGVTLENFQTNKKYNKHYIHINI